MESSSLESGDDYLMDSMAMEAAGVIPVRQVDLSGSVKNGGAVKEQNRYNEQN